MIFKFISKEFLKILMLFFILINTFLISKLHASSFEINEIEVSEDFNLNFNKKKVFDKAFETAFFQLISTVILSKDIKKVEKTSLSTIKSLIDSFDVKDEKFIENKYYAKFNVNFNKKNAYSYFESKNIFPSISKKLNLLLLPLLINVKENKISYLSENPIYTSWQANQEKFYLLNYILPSEEIEDIKIYGSIADTIDNYDFEKIVRKYDLENHIILIIYQNENKINILSKLKFNNKLKILNYNYENLNLKNNKSVNRLIFDLKKLYEDEWKKLNLINTSIKLPLTVSLSSKDNQKVKLFETILEDFDLVSDYIVTSFNNKYIYYKIIYNGPPDKFFNEINSSGLNIEKKDQTWMIQ